MIRLLLVSGFYSYKGLFRWATPEAYFIQKAIYPLAQLVFFSLIGTFGGARPPEFYLVGNALAVAFRPMTSIATAMSDERSAGTLTYLVASPASRRAVFLGRSLFQVVDGCFDVLVAVAFAVVVFGLRPAATSWPGLLLAIAVATVSAAGLGFFLGAVAYVVVDVALLGNVAIFALLLLTGANVALDELPLLLRTAGEALPLTHAIAAARMYSGGAALSAGLPLLGAEAVLGAVWAAGGLLLFHSLELRAQREGSLEAF